MANNYFDNFINEQLAKKKAQEEAEVTRSSAAYQPRASEQSGPNPLTLDSMLANVNLSDEDKKAIAEAYQQLGNRSPDQMQQDAFDTSADNKNYDAFGQAKPVEQQGWTEANSDLSKLHSPTPQEMAMPATPTLAEGQMGPPSPSAQELNARRTENLQALPQSQDPSRLNQLMTSYRSKTPVDTGKLNPLGNIPMGTNSQSVQDILGKLRGQVNPELQDAQEHRNKMQLFSLLGKASNQILGGQTHTKPSNEVFDEIGKNASQGITDIGTRNSLMTEGLKQQDLASKLSDEQAKNDPSSSISVAYRAAVGKMLHGSLPDNVSASQLEKISPIFEKLYNAEQSSLDRSAKAESDNVWKNRMLSNREDSQANILYDKNTALFANRIEGANRVNKVLAKIRSGELIDTNSVYQALNSEISQLFLNTQSGGSLTDREEGRIRSLKAVVAKVAAYIGKPMSSIPADFLPQIELEINALKEEYLDAYSRKSKELQAGTAIQGKKDVYSGRENAFLTQQGIDPKTLKHSAPSQGHPQDAEAIKWAKANPGPQADAILKANGVK